MSPAPHDDNATVTLGIMRDIVTEVARRGVKVTQLYNIHNIYNIYNIYNIHNLYPQRHAAYTYTNFLRAVSAFPGVCHPDSAATCRAVLATMFAHFAQVTTMSTTYLLIIYT